MFNGTTGFGQFLLEPIEGCTGKVTHVKLLKIKVMELAKPVMFAKWKCH
jgi:hypothetical protein